MACRSHSHCLEGEAPSRLLREAAEAVCYMQREALSVTPNSPLRLGAKLCQATTCWFHSRPAAARPPLPSLVPKKPLPGLRRMRCPDWAQSSAAAVQAMTLQSSPTTHCQIYVLGRVPHRLGPQQRRAWPGHLAVGLELLPRHVQEARLLQPLLRLRPGARELAGDLHCTHTSLRAECPGNLGKQCQ